MDCEESLEMMFVYSAEKTKAELLSEGERESLRVREKGRLAM